jgi:hypothetical protein
VTVAHALVMVYNSKMDEPFVEHAQKQEFETLKMLKKSFMK